MFDHLLAPLDGSNLAECALPHVYAIAGAFKSEVILLRVADEAQSNQDGRPIDPLQWQIDKREAGAYLESIVARHSRLGLATQTVLMEGRAAERIVEYARDNHVALMVLSSHGRSGLSGWNISSVAQKILLRPVSSVMVVRAYQPAPPPNENLRYERILLPLDGSLRAECVLPVAMTLAQHCNARLFAIHVVSQPEMVRRTPLSEDDAALAGRVVARNVDEGNLYLQQLRTRLPVEMETRLIQSDSIRVAIHDIVERESIDLVILSAHGYTGNTSWPYGSVVTNMLAYGITPVLIVQDARQEITSPGLEAPTRRPESRPDVQL